MNKSTSLLPTPVIDIIIMLENAGYEAYAAGGCVRDFLLGKEADDYDIATNAKPDEVKKVFENYKVIETGVKHGTVSVLYKEIKVEITTYRLDGPYSDNRRPDCVSFTSSLYFDTQRRDFTINAIMYNPRMGLIDFHGGAEDLKKGIIRCVGQPEKRFGEDALRIIRALRFSSVLGFVIEPYTREAMFVKKSLLKNVSAERINTELTKMVCGKNISEVLVDYIEIIGEIIPELLIMMSFDQHNPYHKYDVLTHTAYVVAGCPPKANIRYAALFHDCAKPLVQSIDDNGIGHYKGHPQESAKIARNVMERLKIDISTQKKVLTLIELHDATVKPDKPGIKRLMNKITPELLFDLFKLQYADAAAKGGKKSLRNVLLAKAERIAKEIIQNNECFNLSSLTINGNDIINQGISEGEKIGQILNSLLSAVIEEKVKNDKIELLEFAKNNLLKENKDEIQEN